MRLTQPFNAAEYAGERSYDVIPPGWYVARITEATIKQTKAGTGEYIAVRYDVLGPTHQGRVVYGNLNISNPNAMAEKIGREQLSDLLRAIGLASLTDTDQLIGGTCQIKIAIQPGQDGYQDRNEIKGWKVTTEAVEGPQTVAAPTTAKAAPPWQRKGA